LHAGHLLDSVREVDREPLRRAGRQRRDHDLVESLRIPHLVQRDERIRVSDGSVRLEALRAHDLERLLEPLARGLAAARAAGRSRDQEGEAT
jgi:hypothetical protein